MSNIKWENVSDSEVRAEIEAVLESTGETKRIRSFLNQNESVQEWHEQVKALCHQIIYENGIDNITPDILYDYVAAKARSLFPESVAEEVRSKLVTFLQTQFEDHI